MKGVHEMELEQITEGYFTSRNGMDEAVVLGAESPVLTILNDGIVLSNIDDNMFANKPAIQILLNMEKGVIDMEVGIYSYPYPSNETEKEENTESSESF